MRPDEVELTVVIRVRNLGSAGGWERDGWMPRGDGWGGLVCGHRGRLAGFAGACLVKCDKDTYGGLKINMCPHCASPLGVYASPLSPLPPHCFG